MDNQFSKQMYKGISIIFDVPDLDTPKLLERISGVSELKGKVPDTGFPIEWILAGNQISSFVMSKCKASGIKYFEFKDPKNVSEKLNSSALNSDGSFLLFVDQNALPSSEFISKLIWEISGSRARPYVSGNELARKNASCILCSRRDFFLLAGFNESVSAGICFKELSVRISGFRRKHKVNRGDVSIIDDKFISKAAPEEHRLISKITEKKLYTGNFGDFAQKQPIWSSISLTPISFGNVRSELITEFSVSFVGFAKNQDQITDILMSYMSQTFETSELLIVCPEDLNTEQIKHIDSCQNISILHNSADIAERITCKYFAFLSPGCISMPQRVLRQIEKLILDDKSSCSLSRVTVLDRNKVSFSRDGIWVSTLVGTSGLIKEIVSKFPNIKKGILYHCSLGSHVSMDSPKEFIVLDGERPVFEYRGEKSPPVQVNGQTFFDQIEEICRYRPSIAITDIDLSESAVLRKIPKKVIKGQPNAKWDPQIISGCHRSFSEVFKGWEILSMRDSELMADFDPLLKSPQITDRTKDLLTRLVAIFHHGGISIDADLFLLDLPSRIMSFGLFVGSYSTKVLSMSIFGAEPKNPILGKIIEDIKSMITLSPKVLVKMEQSTGIVMSMIEAERQNGADIFVLPPHCVSALRSPPVAQAFVRSDNGVRTKMLSGIYSGEIDVLPIIGVNCRAGQFKFSNVDDIDFTQIEASVSQMVKSVASEGLGTMIDISRGRNPLISKEESAKRYEKCAGGAGVPKCSFFNADNGRCAKCGCVMEWKVRRAKSVCPVGFW